MWMERNFGCCLLLKESSLRNVPQVKRAAPAPDLISRTRLLVTYVCNQPENPNPCVKSFPHLNFSTHAPCRPRKLYCHGKINPMTCTHTSARKQSTPKTCSDVPARAQCGPDPRNIAV